MELNAQTVTRQKLVATLAKPGADILVTLTPARTHLIHMLIGIVGEVAEFMTVQSRKDALEELGDLKFYVEGFKQGLAELGYSLKDLTDVGYDLTIIKPYYGIEQALTIAMGELVDQTKKLVIYDKPETPDWINKLFVAVYTFEILLDNISDRYGFTDAEIHEDNFTKLSKRYEGIVYSNEAAIARADKQPEVESEGVENLMPGQVAEV